MPPRTVGVTAARAAVPETTLPLQTSVQASPRTNPATPWLAPFSRVPSVPWVESGCASAVVESDWIARGSSSTS